MTEPIDMDALVKKNEKTTRYLKQSVIILPSSVVSLDTSKVLLAYFGVLGLEVLGKLNELPHTKEQFINWIYQHQIEKSLDNASPGVCGFRGSNALMTIADRSSQNHYYDCSHITMTFAALNTLITLGDDLSRINKTALLSSLNKLQLNDGSFMATFDGSENDIRFVYSACCICYILNDWSSINIAKATSYILSCLTYEGAFSQNPEAEAHGGSTYCAVASLDLMNKLDVLSKQQRQKLIQWCLNRQTVGFSGRVNKPWDTCYSFWIGATLQSLDSLKYTNSEANINYIFETYNSITGGFSKWPDCIADPLHTFTGLCGLSLVNFPQLCPIHPSLTISMKSFEFLKTLHDKWNQEKIQAPMEN